MNSPLPWHRDKLVAFDIETTGTDVHTDRIVTAAIVYMAGILRPKTYTWVINPGIPIPTEASDVHGWTTERLTNAPEARDPEPALYEIVGKLGYLLNQGIPVVAMNAAFDLTILENEARRHDIDPLSTRLPHGIRPVIDPMVLDKQLDPYRPGKCDGTQKRAPKCRCGADGKKLVDLCKHYGVLLGDAHTADADAIAAARLLPRIVDRFPDGATTNGNRQPALTAYSVETLHDSQIRWRRDQMDGLRAYFDRTGTEHDGCCGEWPVHTTCAPATAAPVVEEAMF